MTATKDGLTIEEVTTGEAAQTPTMEDVPEGAVVVAEIPKSLHTPRPKKDKQAMALVRVSPRKPLRSKLSMEEKEKVVTIEID